MRTKPLFLAGTLLAMSGCVSMPLSPAEKLTASMAPLDRPALSLQRVPGRPPVALNLAAFGPYAEGDVFEGGEIDAILSQYNGPPLQLQLPKAARNDGSSDEALAKSPADERIGRTRYQPASPKGLNLGPASLDGALMVVPPGLFDRKQGGDKSTDDPGQFIEQIVTALKPGAVLMVVEQQPGSGSGKTGTQESPIGGKPSGVDDFKAHGLNFIGSIPAASQPQGDGGKKTPDQAVPDKSRAGRVFDLYRKPDPNPDPGAAVPP